MTITFKFYHDAAGTQEITSGNPIFSSDEMGSPVPADKQIWFMSLSTGRRIKVKANPGVAQISINVHDLGSGGTEPSTAVKLATSQAGLAAATGGAALNIGTQVNSLAANAVTFWCRLTNAVAADSSNTNLELKTNELNDYVL